MALRIVVRVADRGAAVNVGGPVDTWLKSFMVEARELESYLRANVNDGSARAYNHAEIIGFEFVPQEQEAATAAGG